MSFSDQESRPQIHDSVPKARCIAASAAPAAPLLQPRAAAGEARVPGSCPVVVLGTADWRERGRCASACGLADIVHADVVVATRAQRFRRDQAGWAPRMQVARRARAIVRGCGQRPRNYRIEQSCRWCERSPRRQVWVPTGCRVRCAIPSCPCSAPTGQRSRTSPTWSGTGARQRPRRSTGRSS
jgi:hypothetical protein